MNFKNVLIAAAIGMGLMTATASAAPVKLGVLTCDVEGGWGLILGSKKEVSCVFVGSDSSIEQYDGTISKLGVDVGYTGSKTLVWAVFAAGDSHNEHGVAGTYIGGNIEASAIVGLGVNALVGGFDNSFALQPLSGQVQTGFNATVAVQKLSLH
jgi:hypothetical protein